MRNEPLPRDGLFVFEPPYQTFTAGDGQLAGWATVPGAALVWFIAPGPGLGDLIDKARHRPRSVPLFVVLPEPEEIRDVVPTLRAIPGLRPRGVLPTAGRDLYPALRSLLAAPPRTLHSAVGDHLQFAGIFPDDETRFTVEDIIAAAPRVRSIENLATRMCQSRRTLGRYFRARELPVPSHWLQFARVLHVAVHIQNTRTSINRVSNRYGYPDGFTMSNSMKRLTGYRPTFVREHLGWEWIVEAWLRQEGLDLN